MIETLEQNLEYISRRSDLIAEQKRISFEIWAKEKAEHIISLKENGESVSEYLNIKNDHLAFASPEDCIAFFRILAQNNVSLRDLQSEADERYDVFPPRNPSKISYVKNNYNDVAFLKFSELFSKATVSYGTNFEEVCEDVYNSASDYCILPIESNSGGKLLSFYSLIDKYDLKIFAACDLDEGVSGKRTRYALLSKKSFIYLDDARPSCFEFAITADSSYNLSDILRAAQSSSMSLYRIDALPVSYDDQRFRFHHIFRTEQKSLIPFVMYLDRKYPQHEVIGNYILI